MNTETETKVCHTLADTVEAYQKQQAEIAEEKTRQVEEAREKTLEALASSGLSPLRVEERNLAIFEYDGQEIKLRIFKDHYWQVMREDVCKDCGAKIKTYDRAWTAENIGELVVNPSWEYHYCKHSDPITETSEERLVSALRDLLGLNREE